MSGKNMCILACTPHTYTMQNIGNFKEEALVEFSEAYLDFARCQRPDGSYYGTNGQCRKGKETGAKEAEPKKAKAKKAAAKPAKQPKTKEPPRAMMMKAMDQLAKEDLYKSDTETNKVQMLKDVMALGKALHNKDWDQADERLYSLRDWIQKDDESEEAAEERIKGWFGF